MLSLLPKGAAHTGGALSRLMCMEMMRAMTDGLLTTLALEDARIKQKQTQGNGHQDAQHVHYSTPSL